MGVLLLLVLVGQAAVAVAANLVTLTTRPNSSSNMVKTIETMSPKKKEKKDKQQFTINNSQLTIHNCDAPTRVCTEKLTALTNE